MSSQLTKNAKDPEDLDELLDFSNKSYRDCKSKKSGLEINFPLLYGYIRNRVVFFATPCISQFYSKAALRISSIFLHES